jgi:hypothetical protein
VSSTAVGADPSTVIAGLDPAIHPSSQKLPAKKMDARVKPARDERLAWTQSSISFPRTIHRRGLLRDFWVAERATASNIIVQMDTNSG